MARGAWGKPTALGAGRQSPPAGPAPPRVLLPPVLHPYRCPGPFSQQKSAPVGQGAWGTCRAASQDRLGSTDGGRPAARSGLPARAGRLPRSLPNEAPASSVFHLLGNGVRASASAPPSSLHPAYGAGLSGKSPPTGARPASRGAGPQGRLEGAGVLLFCYLLLGLGAVLITFALIYKKLDCLPFVLTRSIKS